MLVDEGIGWHLSSWHPRKNTAIAEPSGAERARCFPTAEAAQCFFRKLAEGTGVDAGSSNAPAAAARATVDAEASEIDARHAEHVSARPAEPFEWMPVGVIERALACSWQFGMAIRSINGQALDLQVRFINDGVVHILNSQFSPDTTKR